MPEDTSPPPFLTRAGPFAQWAILLVASALLTTLFELAGLPASLLLGPMVAAVSAGANGATIRVHPLPGTGAQAIVGVMIAASFELATVVAFLDDWLLIVPAVLATFAASSALGWLISRWKVLPGATAVWGSAPGAATAMVLMAEAFGADARLVAFMQYLRVVIVTITAAVVAAIWVGATGRQGVPVEWFPAIQPVPFATTLVVAVAGAWLARLLRLPSLAFLGVFLLGGALHVGGGLPFQLPEWLLAASYGLVGWSIGLQFNRRAVRHALQALPSVTAAIIVLIAFCGGLAWVLAQFLGIDPLTAYLATSPGGMDAVAIIAAASGNVDLAFIMALQMMRFLLVLLLGPALSRLVSRRLKT